jgi:hypothetical protein
VEVMMAKKKEFVWIEKKAVDMKMRKGVKEGWWFVMIGEKKFIMSAVDKFFDEGDDLSEMF